MNCTWQISFSEGNSTRFKLTSKPGFEYQKIPIEHIHRSISTYRCDTVKALIPCDKHTHAKFSNLYFCCYHHNSSSSISKRELKENVFRPNFIMCECAREMFMFPSKICTSHHHAAGCNAMKCARYERKSLLKTLVEFSFWGLFLFALAYLHVSGENVSDSITMTSFYDLIIAFFSPFTCV